jgi:hypothetical protein
MRIFVVLVCSLALAFAAVGATKKDKKSHKSHAKKKHLVVAKVTGKESHTRLSSLNFIPRRARNEFKV